MQPQSDESGQNQGAPQPGWQFTPNGAAQPAQPAASPTPTAVPEAAPTPQPQPLQPAPTAPPPQQTAPAPQPSLVPGQSISWTASEFMAHQKSPGWYGLLALVGIAVSVAIYLLTKDVISSSVVIVVTIVLGVIAARKPRTLDYRVDTDGIHIGPKSYTYDDFKSFSVIDEGAMNSIDLMPMKRFMPALSMYYEPQDEEHIVDVLSAYLPFAEGTKDSFDRFMHRIRF